MTSQVLLISLALDWKDPCWINTDSKFSCGKQNLFSFLQSHFCLKTFPVAYAFKSFLLENRGF